MQAALRPLSRVGIRTAVIVEHMGMGFMVPLTVLYFTVATPMSVEQVSTALMIAGFLALPISLVTGVLVDRIGVRLARVCNCLLTAFGAIGFLLVSQFWILLAAQLLAKIGERVYWAAWVPYISGVRGTRSFDETFADLQATKTASMGLGAAVGFASLSLFDAAWTARSLVAAFALASVVAAVLYFGQNIAKPEFPSATALGQLREVVDVRAHRLICLGAFLMGPVMLLSATAYAVLVGQVWGMPTAAATLIYGLQTAMVALGQTRIARAVAEVPRGTLVACGVAVSSALICTVWMFADAARPVQWAVVAVVGLALGLADTLYLPAMNSLMDRIPPERNKGAAIGLFQLFSGAGISLYALASPLLTSGHQLAFWVMTLCSIVCGATAFVVVDRRAD